MYTRILSKPTSSILLLGPRGVGKSTWIHQNFPEAPSYDLLNSKESLRLLSHPEQLYDELKDMPPKSWVVIDEVQKVPALMDEVHRLIENHRLNFILSGSSARKLKKGSANLLAGRALFSPMFPLVSSEIRFDLDLCRVCQYGMLPIALTSKEPQSYLETYVGTYLQEEIKGEALTRNLAGFARFLEIASRQNGQITNITNIGRDAMVGRQTTQGYFDILCDTLLGFWLGPWKSKKSNKQFLSPKFYFFDSGVARSLSGRLPYPPTPDELGFLFETFVMHEVRAYLAYSRLNYLIHFWSSYNDVEVDLICETCNGFVGIEIKSTQRWDKRYHFGLKRLAEEIGKKKMTGYGIYGGEREITIDGIKVFPFNIFLKRMWGGEIFK